MKLTRLDVVGKVRKDGFVILLFLLVIGLTGRLAPKISVMHLREKSFKNRHIIDTG